MPQSEKSGLSFGYVCIDQLIDADRLIYMPDADSNYSSIVCIAGPDGVGKSILALTLASTYAASNSQNTRVIYASTDLNFPQANSSWKHFGLDQPKARRQEIRDRLERLYVDDEMFQKINLDLKPRCELAWVSPSSNDAGTSSATPQIVSPVLQPFQSIFEKPDPDEDIDTARVHFLDLARYSAGDDWGQLNHSIGLLRLLQQPSDADAVPHLLVIDAVEGLEAMAGRFDRFGLERTRRSRLAQIVRLAQKCSCHVVFIVEQKNQDRLDEVFVSDLVLRLRADQTDEYLQKTIEIEKARSVSHIRGKQELQIRSGKGADEDSPDDPCLQLQRTDTDGNESSSFLGYLQVIPSLHQKTPAKSQAAISRGESNSKNGEPDE